MVSHDSTTTSDHVRGCVKRYAQSAAIWLRQHGSSSRRSAMTLVAYARELTLLTLVQRENICMTLRL